MLAAEWLKKSWAVTFEDLLPIGSWSQDFLALVF